MASADIQSFETEATVTTFEMKTLEVSAETAPVVEMRNKAQPINHVGK